MTLPKRVLKTKFCLSVTVQCFLSGLTRPDVISCAINFYAYYYFWCLFLLLVLLASDPVNLGIC